MPSLQELSEAGVALSEKAIGLTKEVVGTIFGNDDLRRSGQAQQRKATERLEAAESEIRADAERGKALGKGQEQKRYQDPDHRSEASEFDKGGAAEAGSATGEKVKGALKQAAGAVVGNDDLRKEGSVQQDKANYKARAAKEEGKAEAHRARAKEAEAEQESVESR